MKYECYDCGSIFDIDKSNDGSCPKCKGFHIGDYEVYNDKEYEEEDFDEFEDEDLD